MFEFLGELKSVVTKLAHGHVSKIPSPEGVPLTGLAALQVVLVVVLCG